MEPAIDPPPIIRGNSSSSESWTGGDPPHVCNCIGCCPKCGQCRTSSWHARTCKDIEAINKMKDEIIRKAK